MYLSLSAAFSGVAKVAMGFQPWGAPNGTEDGLRLLILGNDGTSGVWWALLVHLQQCEMTDASTAMVTRMNTLCGAGWLSSSDTAALCAMFSMKLQVVMN
eukprot:891680-Amphidinium_carterae.1